MGISLFHDIIFTGFAVAPSVSRVTATAITAIKIDAGSSVLAWTFGALVNICK